MMNPRPLLALRSLAALVLRARAQPRSPRRRSLRRVAETRDARPQGDVLDVAAATGQFTQFLAAVEAAGYEETLRGEGPFTIFAPTDEAFRQMDQREA